MYVAPKMRFLIDRYREEATRLSDDELDAVDIVFVDERIERRENKELNEDIARIIGMANSFTEFETMWKGSRHCDLYSKEELLVIWMDFMEGKAGDNSEENL